MSDSVSAVHKPSRVKPHSASEIAKNTKFFEKWTTSQGCKVATYDDIPDEFFHEVEAVFDTTGKLPAAWLEEGSDLNGTLSSDLVTFFRNAREDCPALFSDQVDPADSRDLLTGIICSFGGWKTLKNIVDRNEKRSEASDVCSVYTMIRRLAIEKSDYRVQTPLSLPEPLPHCTKITNRTVRILNASTIVPDNMVFLPASLGRRLSASTSSLWNKLKWDCRLGTDISDSKSSERSLNFQATPCQQLPEVEGFEFASSVWEDKKPKKHVSDEAYRQNRMSCAGVVRQLAAFGVEVPVFGLVWENGTVRAHIDWHATENGKQAVLSAPYTKNDDWRPHVWDLEKPGDALQVFLLVRNIDDWTVNGFYDRVRKGLAATVKQLKKGSRHFVPWRRAGILEPTPDPRTRRGSRSSMGSTTSVVVQRTRVSDTGTSRTTVAVRQEEPVRRVGRRTPRASMESIQEEEPVEAPEPAPQARAFAKGKAPVRAGPSKATARSRCQTVDRDAVVRKTSTVHAAATSKTTTTTRGKTKDVQKDVVVRATTSTTVTKGKRKAAPVLAEAVPNAGPSSATEEKKTRRPRGTTRANATTTTSFGEGRSLLTQSGARKENTRAKEEVAEAVQLRRSPRKRSCQ